MSSGGFDFQAFYATLDGARRNRALTWRQVARAASVSPSSITRMSQGSRPDIDTIASLAVWAGVDASSFFQTQASTDALTMAAAYIHQDPQLTPEAAAALEQVVRATYSQLASQSPPRVKRRTR
jgi:transcriptional regulator with XRE-family HTH domain